MDTTSVAPTTTREKRGLALYRELGEGIEKVARDFYLVPSQDGERFYHVDYAGETCDCADHEYRGVACVHVYAAGVWISKHRAKASRCDGCGRIPPQGLVEVGPEHVAHGHEAQEGQRYCRPCAGRAGVV